MEGRLREVETILDPLLVNLEKKTFEDLPIKKFLDIGELTKFAPKQNSDSEIKSTKEVIESWIETEIRTEKKAIVMIDEVPVKSIFQLHFANKKKWEVMKKKKFRNSGSVPFLFDLCFLSKHKNIQFVIIMTPSNIYPEGDFPKVFDFPQTEYGERKIIEVDGSYHYRDLAITNNIIPQSKVDQCLRLNFTTTYQQDTATVLKSWISSNLLLKKIVTINSVITRISQWILANCHHHTHFQMASNQLFGSRP